jgi:hypothetical protein
MKIKDVRLCQVGLGYVRLVHVNLVSSCYVRLVQVMTCNFWLGQVFRLGMVKTVYVSLCYAKVGQVMPG